MRPPRLPISVPRAEAANRLPKGSTRFCKGMQKLFVAYFPSMKYTQDDEAIAHHTIVHHIRRIKSADNELAKIRATPQGAPQFGLLDQQIRFLNDFTTD